MSCKGKPFRAILAGCFVLLPDMFRRYITVLSTKNQAGVPVTDRLQGNGGNSICQAKKTAQVVVGAHKHTQINAAHEKVERPRIDVHQVPLAGRHPRVPDCSGLTVLLR